MDVELAILAHHSHHLIINYIFENVCNGMLNYESLLLSFFFRCMRTSTIKLWPTAAASSCPSLSLSFSHSRSIAAWCAFFFLCRDRLLFSPLISSHGTIGMVLNECKCLIHTTTNAIRTDKETHQMRSTNERFVTDNRLMPLKSILSFIFLCHNHHFVYTGLSSFY